MCEPSSVLAQSLLNRFHYNANMLSMSGTVRIRIFAIMNNSRGKFLIVLMISLNQSMVFVFFFFSVYTELCTMPSLRNIEMKTLFVIPKEPRI